MHSKTAVIAAAAIASLIPSALAGTASIKNQCKDTAYLWSIAGSAGEDMITLKSGETYSEEYRKNGNGGGLSIKIALDKHQNDVSQFEYTLSDSEDKVYYDLSNIDGYPFKEGGISITPSDPDCPTVTCPAGEGTCKEAYNQPYDDHATHGCPIESDLAMVLCPDGSPKAARTVSHPHWRQA
ncbi:hypothetical protein AJ80_03145 [Polytolypa hystricis UAMH7299]|uniref:Antigenic thaumatin-like protein n=1 Tax=Polytolypa hystricis (strain UAMH7299) TaxID=1447883 RepID=A0A2B7YJT8_POLH7|nr:hypothetical protein AJ80_03145 [Polytolypa hystricis UAMH7299]